MSKAETLIIRADANPQIGSGHVMRCLALAQIWQDNGGEVIFVMAPGSEKINERLEAENIKIHESNTQTGSDEDIGRTIDIAHANSAGWIVLDGYQFTSDNQKQIKDAGLDLLCLDDNTDYEHYYADIILNQNIHARREMYPDNIREYYTRMLLGTEFCLLRREFIKQREETQNGTSTPNKIMVTLGGADPENITAKVLAVLEECKAENIQVRAIIGANNTNYPTIIDTAKQLTYPCETIHNADDKTMVECMQWADFAISASGSTVWELASLSVPAMLVITADNQIGIAQDLSKNHNYAILQKDFTSDELSEKLHAYFQNTVTIDIPKVASKTHRIPKAMAAKISTLRPATEHDCKLLWEWANDNDTRKNAFSQGQIPWDTHQKWFDAKMNSDTTHIFIAENRKGTPLGGIRFDYTDGIYTITYSIDKCYRGYGAGTMIIKHGVDIMKSIKDDAAFVANVKKFNIASIKALEKCGFYLSPNNDPKNNYLSFMY